MLFKEVTAPGYFDFSADQTAATKRLSDAFNGVFAYIEAQETLMESVFENWKTRDYSAVTIARTPFVKYQLQQAGLDWFRGDELQAATLAGFVQAGFSENTIENIYAILNLLSDDPFNWCDFDTLQIDLGVKVPAVASETLVIYSDAGAPPATPSPTVYVERDWSAPVGWTLTAASATYISYGVLDGYGQIVWSAPYDVTAVDYFFNASLTGMPAASAGDVCIVDDDGTDDTTSSYYYDGGSWQKFSTEYDKQGLVSDGLPADPSQRVVAAVDPNISSTPLASGYAPPTSGLSGGYGIFAGLSEIITGAFNININIILTDAGLANLGMIINLLRRIKPTLNALFLVYTHDYDIDTIEIKDIGEI